jgi:uncharacterized cupredoxin-like copper-binding protein
LASANRKDELGDCDYHKVGCLKQPHNPNQGKEEGRKMSKSLVLSVALVVVAAFVLSACGGAPAQAARKPVDVQITLTEFKIESSVTDFAVGTPYHFVIINKGALAHDWMIMPRGEQDESKALIKVEDTDLQPNETVTRDFTFTQTGDLEFACHVKGHYEAGMHTPITVK